MLTPAEKLKGISSWEPLWKSVREKTSVNASGDCNEHRESQQGVSLFFFYHPIFSPENWWELDLFWYMQVFYILALMWWVNCVCPLYKAVSLYQVQQGQLKTSEWTDWKARSEKLLLNAIFPIFNQLLTKSSNRHVAASFVASSCAY